MTPARRQTFRRRRGGVRLATRALVIAPAGYFVLRTPLLPFGEFLALGDAGRQRTGAGLRALVARPEVREALFLASPELDEAVERWLADPDGERGQRVERAVMRYLARMAGRPTPFGLFAGWTVGEVRAAAASQLELVSLREYRRHTRLDGGSVEALVEQLAASHAGRLPLEPNRSLVRSGRELRVIASVGAGQGRAHQQIAVEATPHLDAVLSRAAGGASACELAAVLTDGEVSSAEAAAFVAALVERQILVPRLAAPLTGQPAIDHLIAELPEGEGAARLRALRAELAALDEAPLGLAPARYRALAAPVQVDCAKPARAAVIGGALLADIELAIRVLHRLADPPGPESLLSRIKQAMAIRFEDTEVGEIPLLELLDEDGGLVEPLEWSPVIDGLPLADEERETRLRPRDRALLEMVIAAAATGARSIELTDRDLDRISAPDRLPLPDSLEAFVTAIAASPEALAGGEHQILCHAVVGPPGVGLVSRFCAADPQLLAHVRAQLAAEEAHRPDAVFAELVHLPDGRMANVIQRPLLRAHEIAYAGTSGAPASAQIPLADLTVSLAGDRLVLRSRRLGREVIPRLSCLDVEEVRPMLLHRFLVELQSQGVAADLRWRWGALEGLPFLPRVVHRRLILALARWRLGADQLAPLAAMDGDDRARHLQAVRLRLALPRLVALADGDRLLPVDLDNPIAVAALADKLARRASAVLTEVCPGEGELAVSGPEGLFTSELVVPFVAAPRARVAPPRRPGLHIGASRFGARSGWLFAKIYAGPAAVDRALRDAVPELVSLRAVDRWFFVRYGDPGWHLRLRLHGAPARLAGELLPALEAALERLLATRRIVRAALDTYTPEVDRYGGPLGLELAEKLFQVDSEAVLAALDWLPADDAHLRWRLALAGADQVLCDLGLGLDDRLALVSRARDRLLAEVGAGAETERALGARFRPLRGALESLLDGGDPALASALAALSAHRARRRWLAARLRRAERAGRLTRPVAELAHSHVHMHLNRMLRGAHLAHELCIHDFLARLYRGQAARGRISVRGPHTAGGGR